MLRLGMILATLSAMTQALLAEPAKPVPLAGEAASMLDATLRQTAPLPANSDTLIELRSTARKVVATLGEHWNASQSLLAALRTAEPLDPGQAVPLLRNVMKRVADDLSFRPMMEAELPVGFPEPTIVGEVEVKQYPVYRLARAGKDVKSSSRFWTLFRHIQSRDIPMTAPVEMTMSGPSRGSEQAMAFLYPSTETGTLGTQGGVEVVDVPPMTVVSIGVRGRATDERIAEAKATLDRYLAVNANRWTTAGEMRLMGFNSPFVRDSKQYFEVQVPVKPATKLAVEP